MPDEVYADFAHYHSVIRGGGDYLTYVTKTSLKPHEIAQLRAKEAALLSQVGAGV